jgi:hypothetical protein
VKAPHATEGQIIGQGELGARGFDLADVAAWGRMAHRRVRSLSSPLQPPIGAPAVTRFVVSLLMLASLLVIAVREPAVAGTGDGKKAEQKPKRKFTIGKDTTYFTEPLNADGCIDYVAAAKAMTVKTHPVGLLLPGVN